VFKPPIWHNPRYLRRLARKKKLTDKYIEQFIEEKKSSQKMTGRKDWCNTFVRFDTLSNF